MAAYGDGTYGSDAYGGVLSTNLAVLPPVVKVEIDFVDNPFGGSLGLDFAIASVTAGQSNWYYVDWTAISDYTIQSGDVLEYFIWPVAGRPYVGLDIASAGWALRVQGATDQNGRSSHPSTDLSAVAGTWYYRQIPLTRSSSVPGATLPAVDGTGQTINNWMFAFEHLGTGSAQFGFAYVGQIAITNGGRVAKKIWGEADPPPTSPSLATVFAAPPVGNVLAVSKVSPTSFTWTDVTPYVMEIDTQRGRNHELDRIDPGTAAVSFDNQDRRFDPTNTAGPYYPNVLPMRKIRVRALWPLNQITNASFETDLSGWSLNDTVASVTATRDLTQHQDGVASLKLVNSAAGQDDFYSTVVPGLKPGATYTISAYVNVTAFTSGALSNRGLYAVPLIAGGAYNAGAQVASTIVATTAGFVQRTVTVTLGPSDNAAEVRLYAPQGTVYWDAVQLEEGATASAFVGSGIWYYLFTGFVERWPSSQRGRMNEVRVTAVDALTALGDVTINKFYAQDFSGNRIAAVLDDSGWPVTDRVIATGNSQVQPLAASTGGTEIVALAHIQDVADAELGEFFADGSGRVVFQNRLARIQPPYSVSQATFYDAPTTASGNLLYVDVTPSDDSDQIYNYVSVTPASASTPQVSEDLTSQKQYGRRSLIRTPIILTTGEAFDQANYLLGRYKQPSVRFDEIVIEPKRQAALWPQALGRDMSDRITIQRQPPGGGPAIVRVVHIEQIRHSIRAARGQSNVQWQTFWSVSPADVQAYWALAGAAGDAWSANSVLDSTTRLAY